MEVKKMSEQKILAHSPPQYTHSKKIWMVLTYDYLKIVHAVSICYFVHIHNVHGFSQREFNSVTLSYYNL